MVCQPKHFGRQCMLFNTFSNLADGDEPKSELVKAREAAQFLDEPVGFKK